MHPLHHIVFFRIKTIKTEEKHGAQQERGLATWSARAHGAAGAGAHDAPHQVA
jgi:hypothetical protein